MSRQHRRELQSSSFLPSVPTPHRNGSWSFSLAITMRASHIGEGEDGNGWRAGGHVLGGVVVLGPTVGGEEQEVRSRMSLCLGRIVEVPNGVVTLACREQHIT